MIKIAIFSSHPFEKPFLVDSNRDRYELIFIDEALSSRNTMACSGCKGIALFTSDDASAKVLESLKSQDIEFIVTRSAGYDHIDIKKSKELEIKIANVPAYSPNAIAEHTVALMLCMNRHLIESEKRIKRNDFSINGLTGFNLEGKTVGIIGTGRIGAVLCKILNGFGCRLLAVDICHNNFLEKEYNVKYVSLDELCIHSNIISLHTPLDESTKYMINEKTIYLMKEGMMLINTSRGGLINTADVIRGLQSGKIRYLGIDVYENEKGIFFHDLSQTGIEDETLQQLIKMKNVLITSHHAFLTDEALKNIADTTMENIDSFVNGQINPNAIN